MNLVVVLFSIIITAGGDTRIEISEWDFPSQAECEVRASAIADPWLVCGETTADFLVAVLKSRMAAAQPIF